MKRTALYDIHLKYGGKMIEFFGWELPVQYTGIKEEHIRVRDAAGLFDVSHMGEILVTGPGAEGLVEYIGTNSISTAEDYQVVYSPMCNHGGGVVDDLLVYKFNRDKYLLVVNASNTDKDYNWILNLSKGYNANVTNVSDRYAQLALQGPRAQEILQKLTDYPLGDLKFFRFRDNININGANAIVSRTGYTGEDGFEIYIDPADAAGVWEGILKAGSDEGVAPVGLGARDTLRFEACLPLYGHELDEDISPLEAGLGMFVKLDKEDFVGKKALAAQKEQGVPRSLAGFEMVDRGVPRGGYPVVKDGETIGKVTSGSYSPTLEKNLGLALIDAKYNQMDGNINVVVRNRELKAQIIRKPFYRKKYKK